MRSRYRASDSLGRRWVRLACDLEWGWIVTRPDAVISFICAHVIASEAPTKSVYRKHGGGEAELLEDRECDLVRTSDSRRRW
jgi:hypothetical protein